MTARPAGPSSFTVGDIRLTLIPDGYHRCDPLGTFVGSTPANWDEHAHLLDEQGRLVMTMGALLAELPSGQRILIDAGFGPRTLILSDFGMEFWGGRLVSSLAAVGLRPEDIDVVLYSHLHVDHVGWTATDHGTPTFTSARHLMSRAEWEHWSDKADMGGPTQADIDVLAARVELLDGEGDVAPGIAAVPTYGHTPGHLSFRVTSGDERALILGDAIHCPLQISHPEWAFMADAAPDAARRAREQLLRELDEPGTAVVGAHFPDAVFGRVVTEPTGRRVAFDVAVPGPPQTIAPDAEPHAIELPPLD